ncbi:MAG: hypothetical protein IKV69_00280 [Clostridia bacterium]|nr:hypothetical protein [Clostridia bacterium]
MLKKVLSEKLYTLLEQKIGFDNIYEVRLRANMAAMVIQNGQAYFLSAQGLTYNQENGIRLSKPEIEDIIFRASEFSIYSIQEELKQGFVVLDDGVRIGVCGNVVTENGKIKTITNFSSLNIRIPHIIRGACKPAFSKLVNKEEIFNTLVISPPGQGKTTFLRDFVFTLSTQNYFFNILVLDERGEIAGKNPLKTVGCMCDVLSFCTKEIGFLQGIRAMNPDIILTDELGEDKDFLAVKMASISGVKVVASIHAKSLEDLKQKPHFDIIKNTFERFVLLAPFGRAGQVVGVYDSDFNEVKEQKYD